jgi:hypothetical protein
VAYGDLRIEIGWCAAKLLRNKEISTACLVTNKARVIVDGGGIRRARKREKSGSKVNARVANQHGHQSPAFLHQTLLST